MKIGDEVRLNKKTVEELDGMMERNPKLMKFHSNLLGIVTNIQPNELLEQPDIIIVKHKDNFEGTYLKTDLELYKKQYRLEVSGESSGVTERYLTEEEYNLLDSVFNELSSYATYENLTIVEIK